MSEALKIALLGAGQLGGSFALAVRAGGAFITAYDTNARHAQALKESGAVDEVAASAADAAKDADLVMLAAPLRSYRELAQAIAPMLKPGTIVTDLGSVKATLLNLATLLPGARLVGGHPIAGSEKSGPESARGDVFRGKLFVVTPNENTDAGALHAVETLWQIAGADILPMPAPVHDQIYAHVSHLPHFIAFVAASYFHAMGVDVGDDPTLQRFLRISRSNPRMWSDIALENRDALLTALSTYVAVLEHFASELRAGEPPASEGSPHSADGPREPETLRPNEIVKRFLPRVLAASLISNVSLYEKQSGMDLRPFGAGGMRDIVAPAATAPEADMEAISKVAPRLADALDGILPRFHELAAMIGAEDEEKLRALVARMVDDAHALNETRQ